MNIEALICQEDDTEDLAVSKIIVKFLIKVFFVKVSIHFQLQLKVLSASACQVQGNQMRKEHNKNGVLQKGAFVEKPVETLTSIRVACHMVRPPIS